MPHTHIHVHVCTHTFTHQMSHLMLAFSLFTTWRQNKECRGGGGGRGRAAKQGMRGGGGGREGSRLLTWSADKTCVYSTKMGNARQSPHAFMPLPTPHLCAMHPGTLPLPVLNTLPSTMTSMLPAPTSTHCLLPCLPHPALCYPGPASPAFCPASPTQPVLCPPAPPLTSGAAHKGVMTGWADTRSPTWGHRREGGWVGGWVGDGCSVCACVCGGGR